MFYFYRSAWLKKEVYRVCIKVVFFMFKLQQMYHRSWLWVFSSSHSDDRENPSVPKSIIQFSIMNWTSTSMSQWNHLDDWSKSASGRLTVKLQWFPDLCLQSCSHDGTFDKDKWFKSMLIRCNFKLNKPCHSLCVFWNICTVSAI